MRSIAIGVCLFFTSLLVWGKQMPQQLRSDHRMQVVAFQKNNVVEVRGQQFINTMIEFGQNEAILGVYLGDQLAWHAKISQVKPNILLIKPRLLTSDTDMLVITNREKYLFHLVTSSKDKSTTATATYAIEFVYPEREFKHHLLSLKENQSVPRLSHASKKNPAQWNWNYRFYGDRSLAPIQAYDDGQMSFFMLLPHAPVPAVYSVDQKGNESLLNTRIEGRYLVVEAVQRQYTFRYGTRETSVFNLGFPS